MRINSLFSLALGWVLMLPAGAQAAVFLNEVYINPPGTSDDGREFIELLGTPGMKLDGYAIAILNGTQQKLYYPAGSIPPIPIPAPEIEELFSLDGLALGSNGILVLGIQSESTFWYPTLLSDSNFARWTTLWNGGLDIPGQLGNDGSFTMMLVRNRPGQTEADPTNPGGLRWGKEIAHDAELITPVIDPQDFLEKDQWGDGNLDQSQPNGLGGDTLDMVGAGTFGDVTDDLELVDEVSFEDGRGWEYEVDGRHVDDGSTAPGLPHRHVHALDDPGGFNPDALSRVDYRTTGDGWPPATGGTGEMLNGNNWQDTSTEQWIRGEAVVYTISGQGAPPWFCYDNVVNTNGDAVQPWDTHVPLWLDDASPPDYDFTTNGTYQVMASRINPLAIPFIPGDCDRDGDCDTDDIAELAAVFGDDDWVFSNAFALSPEGDSGDPATQTRPWDVDATGDNGIEASDLQWTLNFQGDTTGQIVGLQYVSTNGATSGVILNANTGVECTVTTTVTIPSGRTLTTLLVGDTVQVYVKGQLTAGANTTTGERNGIMQFVNDVAVSVPGVLKVTSIWRQLFSATRTSLQTPQGTDGDLGMDLVNGYVTAFNLGTVSPVTLYRVTLEAVGWGAADISIAPAAAAKFAASTPHGLKIGHTDSNGDPASSVYPAPLSATSAFRGDLDRDGDLDLDDWDLMEPCLTGPGGGILPGCDGADLDADDDFDLDDFALFQLNFTGPG